MSGENFDVARADVGGGTQVFSRIEGPQINYIESQVALSSTERRGVDGVAAGRAGSTMSLDRMTESVTQMRNSLLAGDMAGFGEQMKQLGNINSNDLKSIVRQLQPAFEGTGINLRVAEQGGTARLQISRMVNDRGEQIVGTNGKLQTFSFTPGSENPRVRLTTRGANSGAGSHIPMDQARNIFTDIGQRLRTRA